MEPEVAKQLVKFSVDARNVLCNSDFGADAALMGGYKSAPASIDCELLKTTHCEWRTSAGGTRANRYSTK
jgi:hypothetical protein